MKVKYSLTKHVKKQELVELFLNLSDSFDENIPDIIWGPSEFEVDIPEEDVVCDINYISTKKGGEFSVKISWITATGKKEKVKEIEEKTKEKIQKVSTEKGKTTKSKPVKTKKVSSPGVETDDELWSEDDEDWDIEDEEEFDSEDFDDEW